MKKIIVTLTDEQHARLDLIAKLINSTPEKFIIGQTFQSLDACADDWSTWEECFCYSIDDYVDGGAASEHPIGARIEDSAPERRLRALGYVPAELVEA